MRWQVPCGLIPLSKARLQRQAVGVKTSNIATGREHEHGNVPSNLDLQSSGKVDAGRSSSANLHDIPCTSLDPVTLESNLRRCGNAKDLSQGRQIHRCIIQMGLGQDVLLGNLLIQMYQKCGALQSAKEVFDGMNNRNSYSWNIMISAYAQRGHLDDAIFLFRQMPQKNMVSWNTMIKAYAGCGMLTEALHFFLQMPKRDVVSWTTIVIGYARQGKLVDAYQIFQQMPRRDVVSWNTIISAFAQEGCLKEALWLFRHMPEPDVVSWNAMIAGYVQNGHLEEALNFFLKMPQPDVVSWTTLLTGYAHGGHFKEALFIFQQMPCRDFVSWNAMITAYVQHERLDEALVLFQQMPQKNVASWNSIIAGYVLKQDLNEIFQVFHKMQEEDMRPNVVTFLNIIDACMIHATLAQGRWLHSCIEEHGFNSFVTVQNALITMYSKCGSLEDAQMVFNDMSQRNTVSWNALIAAYAHHGYGNEALQVVQEMEADGMALDEGTLYCILLASSHANMVNKGCHYFLYVSGLLAIHPSLKHHNCFLDLLGRTNNLEEAESWIMHMPFEADATSWRALLGACKTYADVKRARYAAYKVFELDPQDSASYMLLANLLTDFNYCNDTEDTRKLIVSAGSNH